MRTVTVFSRETLRPLRVVSTSQMLPTAGAGEAHLDGHFWPDYHLVITADDMGTEVLAAVPCPPAEPPPRAGHVHTLDTQSWTWSTCLTLDGAREAKRTEIKARRAAEVQAHIVVASRLWQVGAASRDSMRNQLDVAAAVGRTWSTVWKFADNRRAAVTAADLRAVLVAFAQRENAAHQRAAALCDRIDAAQTIDELNSINWTGSTGNTQ